MDKILFYFPYRGIGGVSLLFQRLSSYISRSHQVCLIDFHDGSMVQGAQKEVEIIDFERSAHYPNHSVVILQSVPPWNIRDLEKFDQDTKVLFWNLHPLNFYPYIFSIHSNNFIKSLVAKILIPLSFLRHKKLSKLLDYLVSKNSLVFMDEENYEKTRSFYPMLEIPKRLLPILSLPGKICSQSSHDVLQCCWIGRIVDFKVHILLHLLSRLDKAVAVVGPIEMTVIGDGNCLDYLKGKSQSFKNITINFKGALPADSLDDFFCSNVDILFAMGTGALEGASRSLPTILLDYSYTSIKCIYKFDYIYEKTGISLGELVNLNRHSELTSTFEAKLLDVKSDKKSIGDACYTHWVNHYSPSFVTPLFLSYAHGAAATIGEMKELGFFSCDPISFACRRLLGAFKFNKIHGFKEY